MKDPSNVQKRRFNPRKNVGHLDVPEAVPCPDTSAEYVSNSGTSSPRLKRKRSLSQQSLGARYLFPFLIFAGTGLIGWKLMSMARSVIASASTSSETNRLLTEGPFPTFQVYSEQAPQCNKLEPQDIDFTLVTQLSQNRMWMMMYHCLRYPHPMSIAVYTNATLEETQEELLTLGCDLNLVKVSVVDAHRVASASDYPVNLLRNLALSQVKTSHTIYVDVDFWTSLDLHEVLHTSSITQALSDDPKLALVLPAFMLFRQCTNYKDCKSNNIPFMPRVKKNVMEMMVNKQGHIFDPTNRGGHGSTRYKSWIRQDTGTLLPINCLKSHRYEPFVVIRWCRDLPPFQMAFNGYGKNKMTWMMQVMRRGYKLSQVGGAFVTHYPHLDSEARTKWNQAPEVLKVNRKDSDAIEVRRPKKADGHLNLTSFKRGQVDRLFVDFRRWLEEYVPDVSRVPMCDEAQDDDSKLWIDKGHPEDHAAAVAAASEKEHKKAAAIAEDNQLIEAEAAAQHEENHEAEESDENEDDDEEAGGDDTTTEEGEEEEENSND